MEEAMAVNVVQGRRDLLYDVPDFFMGKWVIIELSHLHHPVQVHIEQLEHHVKSVFMANNLKAGDNIRVLEAYHSLYFSVSHRGLPRCELALESL